jgi:hypothetical protein
MIASLHGSWIKRVSSFYLQFTIYNVPFSSEPSLAPITGAKVGKTGEKPVTKKSPVSWKTGD